MKNYLVFDAGGTFTKYALMDENAEILEKDKVPTPDYHTKTKEDYYAVLDSVVEKYRNRIEGIAISMPGMLDSRISCISCRKYCWHRAFPALRNSGFRGK